MTPFFTVMQVGCALAVLLLAAAVTRRLHDRGPAGLVGPAAPALPDRRPDRFSRASSNAR
jgi:uncharacterized membrane protein YhaH (DUF805 family)